MSENKTPKKNASTTKNMLTSGVKQVFPKESTGVAPQADNNVLKVTEHCLYVLSAADRESTGRASGAWWVVWATIFMTYLLSYTFYHLYKLDGISANWLEDLALGGGGMLIFIIFTLPFLIRWRRVLPVCFNRKTKKVSAWIKGELLQADWDTIEAHVKTLTIGPRLGVLSVNLYPVKRRMGDRTPWSLPIAGTERQSMTPQEASYMIWEYLRLFMEEGKQAIPEPNPVMKKVSGIKAVLSDNNPFPLKDRDLGQKIFNFILLPIATPFALVSIPTDIIFIGLDKILPKRKPPKELLAACEAGK